MSTVAPRFLGSDLGTVTASFGTVGNEFTSACRVRHM